MAKSAPTQQKGAKNTERHSVPLVTMAQANESEGNDSFPSNRTAATSGRA
jgi:hypothetical protein